MSKKTAHGSETKHADLRKLRDENCKAYGTKSKLSSSIFGAVESQQSSNSAPGNITKLHSEVSVVKAVYAKVAETFLVYSPGSYVSISTFMRLLEGVIPKCWLFGKRSMKTAWLAMFSAILSASKRTQVTNFFIALT